MCDLSKLPETGFVRLPTVLAIFPQGKSSLWKAVAEGRFPRPVKLNPRTTAWPVTALRAHIAKLEG